MLLLYMYIRGSFLVPHDICPCLKAGCSFLRPSGPLFFLYCTAVTFDSSPMGQHSFVTWSRRPLIDSSHSCTQQTLSLCFCPSLPLHAAIDVLMQYPTKSCRASPFPMSISFILLSSDHVSMGLDLFGSTEQTQQRQRIILNACVQMFITKRVCKKVNQGVSTAVVSIITYYASHDVIPSRSPPSPQYPPFDMFFLQTNDILPLPNASSPTTSGSLLET
ncbi:hypothetical protein EDD21DRAFT_201800 [Dissophora ornata]|nr:hypothetical protein EDD21DRAFT_201800 [Dissophora ornata]